MSLVKWFPALAVSACFSAAILLIPGRVDVKVDGVEVETAKQESGSARTTTGTQRTNLNELDGKPVEPLES